MSTFVETWLAAVRAKDPQALHALIADDVVFYSPTVWSPMAGKAMAGLVFASILKVIPDLTYSRHAASDSFVCMEFRGTLPSGRTVEGVDLFELAGGLVTELKVMMRPLSAVAEVKEAMTALLKGFSNLPPQ